MPSIDRDKVLDLCLSIKEAEFSLRVRKDNLESVTTLFTEKSNDVKEYTDKLTKLNAELDEALGVTAPQG